MSLRTNIKFVAQKQHSARLKLNVVLDDELMRIFLTSGFKDEKRMVKTIVRVVPRAYSTNPRNPTSALIIIRLFYTVSRVVLDRIPKAQCFR